MTTTATMAPGVSRRRRIGFTVVGGLVLLLSLPSTASVLAPWFDVNVEGLTHPEDARWSLALEGSVDLLGLVWLLRALIRPERSALLVQYLLVLAVFAGILVTPFAGWPFLVLVAILLLVPLSYPWHRELLTLRSPWGASRPMLVAATALAIPLAAEAAWLVHEQWGLTRGTAADFNIAVTDAEHLVALALAALLAATRRGGWQLMAAGVSITLAYLGLVSLLLPDQPHSWGVLGGSAAIAAAASFAAITKRAAHEHWGRP